MCSYVGVQANLQLYAALYDSMPVFRVWSGDRKKKKMVVAADLESLKEKGK